MFSIICRPEFYEQISNVLIKRGSIIYESKGQDIKASLDEAARVNSSVLILDIDAGSVASIISGIKKFRVARPNTRTILLAPGRAPGDPLVAALIGKGVYDVIAPSVTEDSDALFLAAALERTLDSNPATYADAARWDTGWDEDEQKNDKEIVYRERLIGTGYIVVTGAGRDSGSTTMSIAIAEYLARQKYKVALVEMNHYPVLWRIEDMFHKNIDLYLQANNFCVYRDKIQNLIHQVEGLYSYVVVDLGSSYEPNTESHNENDSNYNIINWHEYLHEMNRAALPILVLGPAHWQWMDFLPLHVNRKIDSHWKIVALNKGAVKELKEYGNIHYGPTILNPFGVSEETAIFVESLLGPVMPKNTKKSNWLTWKCLIPKIKR